MSKDSDCIFHNLSADNAAAQEILWSPIEDILHTIVLPIVCGTGFLTNIAFLFVLLRVPEMRTVTNAYLGNLAVADFWFVTWVGCIYITPYYLTPVRHDSNLRSGIGCGIAFGLAYFGYIASTMLITTVTAERYFAICRPFQHRLISGKKHTIQMISISWLITVVLSGICLPSWIGIKKTCIIWPDAEIYRDFPATVWHCISQSPSLYVFGEITITSPFLIFLPFNLYMYWRIIFTLNKRTDIFSDKRQTEVATRARNQIARLLIVNGSVFFLCQAPYRIVSIHYVMDYFGEGLLSPTNYGILVLLGRLMVLLNSCCNPFIYYATSSLYRDAFRKAFCSRPRQNSK